MSCSVGKPVLMPTLQRTVETEALDAIGTGCPVKDELELGLYEPKDVDVLTEVTTEDELELPGIKRSRKGDGWRGR